MKEKNEKKIDSAELANSIREVNHPCIMAQAIMKRSKATINNYGDFRDVDQAALVLLDLAEFINRYDFSGLDLSTFIAVFDDADDLSEEEFEKALWNLLQHISDLDDTPWASTISSDPSDLSFAFCIRGHAFYIRGMHANSSRKSRRTTAPTIIFSPKTQFEQVKELGMYRNIKELIRSREMEYQGSINPMLSLFEATSEAREYSGRSVDDDWVCPFKLKPKKDTQ